MIRTMIRSGALLLAATLLAGCGTHDTQSHQPQAGGEKYLLAEEPAGAKDVLKQRKESKDGDDVVVVGRIGGEKDPWFQGRAGFWIIDRSFSPCPPGENCPHPWDYCCVPKEDRLSGICVVKFEETPGKMLEGDARKLLGVKELDTVVVRGTARRDDKGNLTVLADGIYRRPEEKKE